MAVTDEKRKQIEAKVDDLLDKGVHWSEFHTELGFTSWDMMRRRFQKRGMSDTFAFLIAARKAQGGYKKGERSSQARPYIPVKKAGHELAAKIHLLLAEGGYWETFAPALGYSSWLAMSKALYKHGLSHTFKYLQDVRREQDGYMQELTGTALARKQSHEERIEELEFMLDYGTSVSELVERLGYYDEKEMLLSVRRARRFDLADDLERRSLAEA